MDELAAAGAFDKRLSFATTRTGWMKAGRSTYTRAADRPQMMPDGVKWRCRSISDIDNMVSAPSREMWQAGRWAVAVWEIRADMQRFLPTHTPGFEVYDCSRGHGDTWTHTGALSRVHVPCSVGVKLHCLSLITATVPGFGVGAPNYTAQPQQGRCAQESFVRLIICLGLVIAVRTGTQVIVW